MKFKNRIEQNRFSITMEVDPPKGSGVKKIMAKLATLAPLIDAVNISACPVAQLRMDPLAFAILLNRHLDLDAVLHITMRDMSLLGLQSHLLGASALGYHNFLVMTGDAARHSDVKETKGVFQSNSLQLLKLMQKMNRGVTSSEKKLNKKTRFFTGATACPGAINLTHEIQRMEKKIAAGASFFQTQPLFLEKNVKVFLDYAQSIQPAILIGTMLLKSHESSIWLNSKVPGLFIPAEILERFEQKDSQEEGIQIALDFWESSRKHLSGLHLFPMNNYEAMKELLQEIQSSRPEPQPEPE
jgi:methionine synthase / methylenetetrahydrofolate reductase(NADPH)